MGVEANLSISEEKGLSSVFWISQVLFAPSRKGRKRQKNGERGRFGAIFKKGGQTPLKPTICCTPIFGSPKSLISVLLFIFGIFFVFWFREMLRGGF